MRSPLLLLSMYLLDNSLYYEGVHLWPEVLRHRQTMR